MFEKFFYKIGLTDCENNFSNTLEYMSLATTRQLPC